jgi:uncharacterized damage-inducible protein DinB
MNADDFRQLFDYHFTVNRKIWDNCIIPLTQEQFTRKVEYSIGSIRNQVVYIMNIDDRWFSGLRGLEVPGFINPVYLHKRDIIRQKWDAVEANMRLYLETVRDDALSSQPFLTTDQDPSRLWQILIHVINHGTDHRAQLLHLLNQLDMKTFPQDYYFYAIGRM